MSDRSLFVLEALPSLACGELVEVSDAAFTFQVKVRPGETLALSSYYPGRYLGSVMESRLAAIFQQLAPDDVDVRPAHLIDAVTGERYQGFSYLTLREAGRYAAGRINPPGKARVFAFSNAPVFDEAIAQAIAAQTFRDVRVSPVRI